MRFYIIFLLSLLVSCSSEKKELNNTGKDKVQRQLETDEQVLKALKEETGNDYSERDVCIQRSNRFKDFILIGYFAYDRGCAGGDCFYKGELNKTGTIAKEVLVDNGWSEESKRLDLAKAFTLEVAGAWESVVMQENEDFRAENMSWEEPKSEKIEEQYMVSAWIRKQSGMRRATSYYKAQYIYDKDGTLSSVNRSSRFSHEF